MNNEATLILLMTLSGVFLVLFYYLYLKYNRFLVKENHLNVFESELEKYSFSRLDNTVTDFQQFNMDTNLIPNLKEINKNLNELQLKHYEDFTSLTKEIRESIRHWYKIFPKNKYFREEVLKLKGKKDMYINRYLSVLFSFNNLQVKNSLIKESLTKIRDMNNNLKDISNNQSFKDLELKKYLDIKSNDNITAILNLEYLLKKNNGKDTKQSQIDKVKNTLDFLRVRMDKLNFVSFKNETLDNQIIKVFNSRVGKLKGSDNLIYKVDLRNELLTKITSVLIDFKTLKEHLSRIEMEKYIKKESDVILKINYILSQISITTNIRNFISKHKNNLIEDIVKFVEKMDSIFYDLDKEAKYKASHLTRINLLNKSYLALKDNHSRFIKFNLSKSDMYNANEIFIALNKLFHSYIKFVLDLKKNLKTLDNYLINKKEIDKYIKNIDYVIYNLERKFIEFPDKIKFRTSQNISYIKASINKNWAKYSNKPKITKSEKNDVYKNILQVNKMVIKTESIVFVYKYIEWAILYLGGYLFKEESLRKNIDSIKSSYDKSEHTRALKDILKALDKYKLN